MEEEELPEHLLADGHKGAESKDELYEYNTEEHWRARFRAEKRNSADWEYDFC